MLVGLVSEEVVGLVVSRSGHAVSPLAFVFLGDALDHGRRAWVSSGQRHAQA